MTLWCRDTSLVDSVSSSEAASGRSPEKTCKKCHGQMRTRQKSRITVKIPAGVEHGATIRLQGKGEAGLRGGRHGDLYMHIQIKPHSIFERKGYDVYMEHTVHLLDAVMGSQPEIETLHGKVTLKIPAGTQSGDTFKVKGKGIPHMRGSGHGDQYVVVKINVPKKLSRKEKELYNELRKEAGLE